MESSQAPNQELILFAFIDRPVRIVWITRSGETKGEQVEHFQEPKAAPADGRKG